MLAPLLQLQRQQAVPTGAGSGTSVNAARVAVREKSGMLQPPMTAPVLTGWWMQGNKAAKKEKSSVFGISFRGLPSGGKSSEDPFMDTIEFAGAGTSTDLVRM